MTTNENLITRFDGVGRLGRASVDRNSGGFAEFLSYGPTPTETTRFEEEIETQGIVLSLEF